VGIRQEHKEHCSAYFATYNSVTCTSLISTVSRALYFSDSNIVSTSTQHDIVHFLSTICLVSLKRVQPPQVIVQ